MSRSVLVTGAGMGLGLEIALRLAQEGFRVYASVPDPAHREPLLARAAERGVTVDAPLLDVTDRAGIAQVVDEIARSDGLYGVVNNAGISLRGYFEDCDDDEIRRVLEVNLFGAMWVTQAALPHMRQARAGRLVFIGSIGGRIASMARTAYCASKFALVGFAESLWQELRPLGISVSLVEPAIVRTERWTVNRGIARRALSPSSPYREWFEREEALADRLVSTSPTRPEHVAAAVYRALTDPRPRLRYGVGWRAGLVWLARRWLPGEWFERIYFEAAMRRVTEPGQASS